MLRWLQQNEHRPEPMTSSTAIRPPARTGKRWTYADYCRIPADGKRHEILDGRHFVNPAPSPYHQTVTSRLLCELMIRIEKTRRGRVFTSPIDVHLGPGSIVQPDVVALRLRNASIIGPKKLTGVPNLLLEVLSPSNRAYDRKRKRARYERAGVREFWLVDPETHSIEQLILRKGRYGPPIACSDSITLRVFRGITSDLREVG